MVLKLYELPIQETGRVVLPAELRKILGLSKGDKVLIEAEGDEVKLTTARLRRKRAQGIARKYARPGVSVVDEFLAEKRVEAEREIARIGPDADKAGGVSRSPAVSIPRRSSLMPLPNGALQKSNAGSMPVRRFPRSRFRRPSRNSVRAA